MVLWAIVNALATFAMNGLDQPLRGTASPLGIVSFELAGSATVAQKILEAWQHNLVIERALLIQYVDYAYLLIYAIFGSALALWATSRRQRLRWGRRAAAMVWAAAGCDCIENVALIVQLRAGLASAPYPEIAAAFASIKFGLLLVALGIVVISLRMRPSGAP